MFDQGLPAKLTAKQFLARYAQYFPSLTENEVRTQQYIDDVYDMFAGVNTLWRPLGMDIWQAKSLICYSFLTAWYLVDMVPELAEEAGVVSSGGIPISSKSIGQVSIKFGNPDTPGGQSNKLNFDLLGSLKSNAFGMKAYLMIKGASAQFRLGVGTTW